MNRKIATFESGRPQVFDAEQMGRSLREVAVDVDADGASLDSTILRRWFHSSSDADLLIWTDQEHNLIKHQVNFFGQVVEWNVFEGVKTGFIVEQETESESAEASELVQFDSAPQAEPIAQAVRLLKNVVALGEVERGKIVENLLHQAQGSKLSAEKFLLRYQDSRLVRSADLAKLSQAIPKPTLEVRPSFWRRLKRWFSGS